MYTVVFTFIENSNPATNQLTDWVNDFLTVLVSLVYYANVCVHRHDNVYVHIGITRYWLSVVVVFFFYLPTEDHNILPRQSNCSFIWHIFEIKQHSYGRDCLYLYTQRPGIYILSFSCTISGNTGSSVSGCTGNEIEKQIGIWERRIKGLRRLLLGWDQARPPDAPASLTVDVTGDNSVQVQILEPFDGAIATKFKGN